MVVFFMVIYHGKTGKNDLKQIQVSVKQQI